MTVIRYALKYCDYLVNRLVAVGPDVDALDLSATTPYYTSTGMCEPIIRSGTCPLYTVKEIDVPDWLIAGLERGQVDGRWCHETALFTAVRIMTDGGSGWEHGLSRLASADKLGKFQKSIIDFFTSRGYITDKQADYCY